MSRSRPDRRKKRREEAEERQRHYDNLSVGHRLAKLDRGGYTAARERTKLGGVTP